MMMTIQKLKETRLNRETVNLKSQGWMETLF